MTIEVSERELIITDPQRRVYNGCIASYKYSWKPFRLLESGLLEKEVEERLTFWKDLNDYAVSHRGESSRKKFRIVEDK